MLQCTGKKYGTRQELAGSTPVENLKELNKKRRTSDFHITNSHKKCTCEFDFPYL